jgi:hypothetical protein
LLTTGNVGIGTTNPAVALDVVGNVQCTAGYNLNYSALPTFASNQIGWSYRQSLSSGISLNGSDVAIFTYSNLPVGIYIVFAAATFSSNGTQQSLYLYNGSTMLSFYITPPVGVGTWSTASVSNIINQTNTANNVKITANGPSNSSVNGGNNYTYYYIIRIA